MIEEIIKLLEQELRPKYSNSEYTWIQIKKALEKIISKSKVAYDILPKY